MEHDSAQDMPSEKSSLVSRRALLRAGTAAAPVLLTLRSGPVAATGTVPCTVASSFVSVATFKSRNASATTMQCSTKDVQYWRDQCVYWKSKSNSQRPAWCKKTVSTYFCSTGSNCNTWPIWQVMSDGNAVSTTGEMGVLQHLLALALSIDVAGAVDTGGVVNTPYLSSVWGNFKSNSNSYKIPASAIDWDHTMVIDWLKRLQSPVAM